MYKRMKLILLAVFFTAAMSACGKQVQIFAGTEEPAGEVITGETDGSAGEAGSFAGREMSGKASTGGFTEEAGGGTGIFVYVCGAVTAPGVYELPEGSRVYEAVGLAGGMTEDAASEYLNLADVLSDGEKVVVPRLSELPAEEQYGPLTETEEGGPVDLNHAGKEALMTLPGIGEARAEAIIAYREEHGAFGSPEDIMQVPGIKEAAYEKLKDSITVR